jgi:tetratricopeptide (TPR) repeat protein
MQPEMMTEMADYPESKFEALPSKYEFPLIVFLAVIVFFIYAKTLTGDYIFDDIHNIKDNPHIRLTQITPEGLIKAALESPSARRPIANISFALNYYFYGYNVVGFHLVNILIHITNGMFLYLLITITLRTPTLRASYLMYRWVPFFAAFIWLVHPIQTQSVSYVVQRMNSMATLFYALSMLLYVQARLAREKRKQVLLFSAAAFCAVLALGSKEIAATLPFFVFLYEWYFFQDLSWEWFKKRIPVWIGMLILLTIIALIFLDGSPLEKILSGYATHHLTMAQRGLSQFRVVIFYISLLLWPRPSRLNLDHADFQPSLSIVDPVTTVFAIGAITGFLVLAILLAKKERLISFCILWYFGNLFIESSIIGLELVFEHRNYLPSMFFIFAAVFLSYRYLKPKWLAPVLLSVVAVVFAFWTYERNDVWRSRVLIWKDCAQKSPQNPRAYNNLGVALADLGHYREAVDQYRRALQINPRYADAYTNFGRAMASQGNIDAAIGHFNTALKISPGNYAAHNNLGIALALQGRHQEAIAHFSEALAINPDFVNAHNNLGAALKNQGRLAEATVHFRTALKIDPHFAPAHNNLGMALADQGRWDEAIAHFSEALRIDPGYENARKNLEDSLAKKNQSDSQSKK